VTPTKSHRRCSGGQDVYNGAWASLPDCGIDLRPDWSRLLVWFIPAVCSTWIMLLSMAIVLHHRPLVRPTGEAIRVVVIEPTVPPVIPSAAAPPARTLARLRPGHRKVRQPAKEPEARPPNDTPRMLTAPATNPNSAPCCVNTFR